ncbi:uncharacterized protein HD556DRAFT_1449994 [Suillus plorans]|uniref:Uncharacterized protein n=1 Tax=Suillus plorans TaxID=116603 RepID=A0A9P7DBI7_9AGAM|nr:uncharacterized protein HD556DRAFT_1449994 [Suillus plorans]KAG1786136.1 hypothetical protein HD556DRAFT_1449994 [Suillus plorans]
MFTSRFAVLALFAFFAGANANGTCAMCQDTVDIEGVAVYTLANSTVETSGYTLCSYTNTKLGIKVTCEYSSDGAFQDGDELCPSKDVEWKQADGSSNLVLQAAGQHQ